jgi:two-component system KDP operon response regulator KdpE
VKPRTGAHLLLVEDDGTAREALAANLVGHGYVVQQVDSVREAVRAWDSTRPDVILLDLGLPDRDGASVIRRVRSEANTPILVLSARTEERDRVQALELGADDYLTKPFGVAELRARVAALLRRAGGPAAEPSGVLRVGPVTLDPARHLVRVGETPVDLTPREYELLKVLLSRPGSVVTRGRLLRAVWGNAYSDEAHYLHVYVSRLRRKLAAAAVDQADVEELIVAEPGVGYRVRADED